MLCQGCESDHHIQDSRPDPALRRWIAEVEVLFSNMSKDESLVASRSLHQEIKESLVKEIPRLKEMAKEELKKDFDKLSRKIAQVLPYKDWKETERAMKGLDRYDPRRFN